MISGNGATDGNGNELAARRAGRRVGELFDQRATAVLRLCRLILRDPVEAEDAAQQTFLSAYRALLRGTEPREPEAWLAQIARNECRARLRRRELAAVPLDPDEATDPTDTAEMASRREQLHAVTEAIGQLPDRQRQAVVLSDLRGLSNSDVARALSVEPGTLEALLYRGRLGVRRALRRSWPATAVVPVSLRDALARLLPGFESSGAPAAAGAALVGAKLLAAPAAKVAAGVAVAAMAVGAATVETERAVVPPKRQAALLPARPVERDALADPASHEGVALRHARRGSESSGPGPGKEGGRREHERHGHGHRKDRHASTPGETESSSGPGHGRGGSRLPVDNSGQGSHETGGGAPTSPPDSSGPSMQVEPSGPSLQAGSSGAGPSTSGSDGPGSGASLVSSGSGSSGSGTSTSGSSSSGSSASRSPSSSGSSSSDSGSSGSESSGSGSSGSSGSGSDGNGGSGE